MASNGVRAEHLRANSIFGLSEICMLRIGRTCGQPFRRCESPADPEKFSRATQSNFNALGGTYASPYHVFTHTMCVNAYRCEKPLLSDTYTLLHRTRFELCETMKTTRSHRRCVCQHGSLMEENNVFEWFEYMATRNIAPNEPIHKCLEFQSILL